MKKINNPSEVKILMAQKKNFFVNTNCFYELIDDEINIDTAIEKIGGKCKNIESLGFDGFTIYVDDYGRCSGQPTNQVASTIAKFEIFGNAFVIFE